MDRRRVDIDRRMRQAIEAHTRKRGFEARVEEPDVQTHAEKSRVESMFFATSASKTLSVAGH